MPLSPEDMRFAMNDARERHKGIVDLIYAGDRQALGVLQLYIALAVASLSGAAVILLSTANTLPRPLGFGLGGFAVMIAIGAVCALITMWPSRLRLSGRDPDFWEWASHPEVTPEQSFRAYLASTEENLAINRATNDRMARAMLSAKCAGAAAPIIGAACGTIALLLRF